MRKSLFPLPVVGLLLLAFLPVCLFLSLKYHFQDRLIPGVNFRGHSLGGLPLTDAGVVIEEVASQLETTPVHFYHGDQTWEVMPREMGIEVNRKALLEMAYKIGRQGSPYQQVQECWQAWRRGRELEAIMVVDDGEWERYFLGLAQEVNKRPQNATVDPDTMLILPECQGLQLDEGATFKVLLEELKNPLTGRLALEVRKIEAATTKKMIASLGELSILGRAATPFDPRDENRTVNLRVAAAALDGSLIKKGEVLSFNTVVGPREPEYGYLKAPEIIAQELVTGFGGGVCQVSSTLFHASLLAGMHVAERHGHSRPSTYILLGLDAAVAYDYLDLKLMNKGLTPLLLTARLRDNQVEVAILGKKWGIEEIHLREKERVEIPIPREEVLDPTLLPGEYLQEEAGAPGYRVTIERVYSLEGREIRRETVSKSYYAPRPRIIRTGVLEASPRTR